MSSAVGSQPAVCGFVAVRLGELGCFFVGVEKGQSEHGVLVGGELGRFGAGAGEQDRRSWLLDRARPDGDGAVAVEAALPAEGLRLCPDREQKVEGFLVHRPAFARVGAVGEELVGDAAEEADHGAAVRERVEHADFLSGSHGVDEREDDAEDGDLDVGVALS